MRLRRRGTEPPQNAWAGSGTGLSRGPSVAGPSGDASDSVIPRHLRMPEGEDRRCRARIDEVICLRHFRSSSQSGRLSLRSPCR
jgi:hypothetical protein